MSDRTRSAARVQFLGSLRIEIGSESVTPESERLFGMIVRLSVPVGRITSRMTMMETLWPGIDEANARHNLRQTVYKARELGLIVESGEDGLRLDPRHWSCDWDDPVGDVPGEWLADYAPEFSPELTAWVTSQRVGVHAMLRPRLIRTLQSARAAGDLSHADRCASQLLDIDGLNEEATLTRAEWMAMQGAKADALRLLDAYLAEIGRLGAGHDAALPAKLLRRRIAEKLPAIAYHDSGVHHGPLVGRHAEAKRLVAAIFDARAGRGEAILLQGPDGSGKSRLLTEVKLASILQGMRVIELAADASQAPVPFATLRALVVLLLDQTGAMGIAPESLARLRAWMVNTAFSPDECPTLAIEDLLAAIADELPLVILHEHAHHMDAASVEQLDWLYRRGVGRHHLLILTSATHATPIESPVALQWIERLPLRPMELSDVRSIVSAWASRELPRAKPDQVACAAVFAEGNPMYGIEMLGLMLDSGSPDVIPWRVKVGVDRALRELTELQWRILTLCYAAEEVASASVLASAISAQDIDLANALHVLEDAGYVRCEAGRLRVSGLLGEAASARLKPPIARLDAAGAAAVIKRRWDTDRVPTDFFAALRLLVSAGEETDSYQLIDSELGNLVRRVSVEKIVYELETLRRSASAAQLREIIDASLIRLREGSMRQRVPVSRAISALTPASLPAVSITSTESEHSIAVHATFAVARQRARDPNASPRARLCEATQALYAAANIGDASALDEAYLAVAAVRNAPDINQFDLHRAELIYFASKGAWVRALESADRVADEARVVQDVSLACLGLRNAAEAHAGFGDTNRAQALLHESRALSATLGYRADQARADLRLAELAILSMDSAGADAYLNAAHETIDAYRIDAPCLLLDLHMFSCWSALLSGRDEVAARAGRRMLRVFKGEKVGTPRNCHLGIKLVIHRGKVGHEFARDFEHLSGSVGGQPFDGIEHFTLAALLVASRKIDRHNEVSERIRTYLPRIIDRGRAIWPFIVQNLANP